ncbi:hypothetical protein GMA11_08465 [Granulicatella sp. zg-ZJ]|uniref:hypothetical protein n=1 Tax=Granulicatella sp. zg-ZJ TaxID=2678504 RepID=UPI0013D86F2C|nr:hypothetical protein [Granulicatella sp. zg-ZJ]NEW63411.1 hypothetical protein [Granulicatella sp. zg-ZJ]
MDVTKSDLLQQVREIYAKHLQMPYISPERDLQAWLNEVSVSSGKIVPKRNMERLDNGLLPGHIILLWRVNFGTYTTDTVISKYFEHTYGIDAQKDIHLLMEQGLVEEESAIVSTRHLTSGVLKSFLKEKQVKGLSSLKRADIDEAIRTHFSEEELTKLFALRGYTLTQKGQETLKCYPEVVDRHPKKKF